MSGAQAARVYGLRAYGLRALVLLLAALGFYVALLLHPQPLFAYEVRVQNLRLHARTPLPAEAVPIAEAALARAARSPFFDPADTYHVYLCDTPRVFHFFAALDQNVGGVSQIYLSGNVFLRPSHVERDRLLGPSGNEVPNERTLTYFIAHELTHTMVARRLGRLAYSRLATWQQEGYADYVAKAGAFDLTSARVAFRAGDKQLDPLRSGLYLRYHLFTAYALEQQRLTPQALLEGYRPSGPIEQALRAP